MLYFVMWSLVNCIEFLKFNFFFTSTLICFFHSFFLFLSRILPFICYFSWILSAVHFLLCLFPSFLFIRFILLSYIDLSSNVFFFFFLIPQLVHWFATCFLNLFKLPSHLFFHSSFFFSFLPNITNTQLLFFCFLLNLKPAILILPNFFLVFSYCIWFPFLLNFLLLIFFFFFYMLSFTVFYFILVLPFSFLFPRFSNDFIKNVKRSTFLISVSIFAFFLHSLNSWTNLSFITHYLSFFSFLTFLRVPFTNFFFLHFLLLSFFIFIYSLSFESPFSFVIY